MSRDGRFQRLIRRRRQVPLEVPVRGDGDSLVASFMAAYDAYNEAEAEFTSEGSVTTYEGKTVLLDDLPARW